MGKPPTVDSERLRRIAPDTFAVALLAALLTFFYWSFLTGRGFIWSDTLNEFYPGVSYFAKSIGSGRFPLWFPGVRDGIPFYSDPQMAVFYPPQWLLIPFVRDGRLPFLVYQRYIVLHYLLGGLFMYAFLRETRLSRVAALTGALVFCLSGYASLEIMTFVIIQVYVWLPLQLLCVHRLTSGKGRLAWLGLTGTMLMSLLAGHQQTTLYCWYLVIAYWLYRSYSNCRKDHGPETMALRRLVRVEAPRLAATFALVFGIAAVMVVPAAENWLHTARPKLPFLEIADTSMPYHQLLAFFVPNFFGRTQSIDSPVPFWGYDPRSVTVLRNPGVNAGPGYWQYWEFGGYAGQIFWVALLLCLFNWRKIEDKSTIRFALAAWLLAVWFMLGRYGGLFQILYYILPGASLFRVPARMSGVTTAAAAILTACAIDLLWRRAQPLRYRQVFLPAAGNACLALVLWFGGEHLGPKLKNSDRLKWSREETLYAFGTSAICAIAVVGVARGQRRWLRTLCLVALPFVSVFDFHHAYGFFQRGHTSPDEYYPITNRLLPLLKEYREQRDPFRFGQIVRGKIGEEIATFRNLPYFHDFLEVPEGYTSFYLDSISKFQGITNEEAKIAIQNIRVTMERDEQGKDWLGTRTNSFARAKFFSRIHHYNSQDALRLTLERGEFDWRNEAAICELPVIAAEHSGEPGQQTNTKDVIQFESITPESYSITYNLNRPGIIFVSQTFYPGWATTDERVKIVETFGAFQGLVISEAGSGRVVVHFSPTVFKWGIAITLFSLALTALLAFAQVRSHPQKLSSADS
jgi:hypothetical protein